TRPLSARDPPQASPARWPGARAAGGRSGNGNGDHAACNAARPPRAPLRRARRGRPEPAPGGPAARAGAVGPAQATTTRGAILTPPRASAALRGGQRAHVAVLLLQRRHLLPVIALLEYLQLLVMALSLSLRRLVVPVVQP